MELQFRPVTSGPRIHTTAYPTARAWHRDGTHVFVISTQAKPDGSLSDPPVWRLELVDISTGEADVLTSIEPDEPLAYPSVLVDHSSAFHFDYAPATDTLVYYDSSCHNFYLMDVGSRKSARMMSEPEGRIHCPPSITADGKRMVYAVLYACEPNRFFGNFMSVIFSLDLDPTGLAAVGEPRVVTSYPARLVEKALYKMPNGVFINHQQINPANHDHYFYAHEFRGVMPDGSLELTRCWQNIDGIDKPVYRPNPGETMTHELIGPSGTALYAVERGGVSKMDFTAGARTMLYECDGTTRLSHIGISPDERWICGDLIFPGGPDDDNCHDSGLMLLDAQTGAYEEITHFKRGASHPRHPHPNFSPDGSHAAFTFADGKNSQVAVIDVRPAQERLRAK